MSDDKEPTEVTKPTEPRIFEAENTDDNRRLVAAQARMYSDAKRLFFARVLIVSVLAVVTAATALIVPELRVAVGGGGGIALLVVAVVVETVEKRQRLQAAATQELFDTRVFKLEWNAVHAKRPPQAAVAQAASRYDGGRDANWYDDTRNTHRPFDILICQASNLGWGASMHRLWGWILGASTIAIAFIAALLWWMLRLPFNEALTALIIPLLTPLKELLGLIRSNFENAVTKEAAERRINDLWDAGMRSREIPSEAIIRSLQDKILILRQTNAYVPDWLDSIFLGRNEAAMRASTTDRVEQARRSSLG